MEKLSLSQRKSEIYLQALRMEMVFLLSRQFKPHPHFLNDFTQATNFLATALDTSAKRLIRTLSQVETRAGNRGGGPGQRRS